MSDLDRYLTEEAVERAARAIYGSERMATPWRDIPGEDQGWFAGQARAALAAVLPDIIQQAKEEALEAVLELHRRRPWDASTDFMHFGQTEFPDQCDHCRRPYPCMTVDAINDALEATP